MPRGQYCVDRMMLGVEYGTDKQLIVLIRQFSAVASAQCKWGSIV